MIDKETNARTRYEAVGRDALVVAWTEDTGDHLETLKEVNDQMQDISVQRQTLYAKYFEKRDGFEHKDLKHMYFDEIHQETLGNDFKSEYPDRTHDESFGNKDSKLGPTVDPKQVREKKKKTRYRDKCTENVHHESFGIRDPKVDLSPTPKEARKQEKKRRCKDTYLETIHHESCWQRALWERGLRMWIVSH